MTTLKNILTLFCLGLALSCFGQGKTTKQNDSIKVLAKFISFEGGDKIHAAKFEVIKDLSNTLRPRDTILVEFYNYLYPDSKIDTVLLTLKKYSNPTSLKDYFICPDYDGKKGIQNAKIEFIDFNYWENCETGKGDCKPLTFNRPKNNGNWFLIMPCGGTQTSIYIDGSNFSTKLNLHSNDCPPYLDLTNLQNGNYTANMLACGLGGRIQFKLQ